MAKRRGDRAAEMVVASYIEQAQARVKEKMYHQLISKRFCSDAQ